MCLHCCKRNTFPFGETLARQTSGGIRAARVKIPQFKTLANVEGPLSPKSAKKNKCFPKVINTRCQLSHCAPPIVADYSGHMQLQTVHPETVPSLPELKHTPFKAYQVGRGEPALSAPRLSSLPLGAGAFSPACHGERCWGGRPDKLIPHVG